MNRNTHSSIYRGLLALYPAGVRSEFADEMTLVFADSIDDARGRGFGAVAMTWLRELKSLPSALFQSHGGQGGFDRNSLAISALAIFTSSLFASRLVANLGLFFTISWVLLGMGMVASGLLLGGGMRRSAGVMLLLAMTMPLFVDRVLLNSLETRQSIAAPGVRADAYLAPTESDATSFLAQMKASKTPRLRTVAKTHGNATLVTSVRAGGVDGMYVALGLLLMTGSAWTGRRLATH